ncbi:diacylglycerol/polyprenol kinase family protein [Spirulina sp. CS-785/01]|uniref:diacylglycerol/polyprenol kinase family protein n=1 Tax=Spirulina sp. CS-785/01 TaxID=3021716 RepID=UPI003FA7CCC8
MAVLSLSSSQIQAGMVAAYLGLLLIIAEGAGRFFKTEPELTRKIVHIGSGNVLLLAWGLNIPSWVAVDASIVAALVALLSYFVPILPSINSVGRQSLGTFFYAVSIGVLTGWFFPVELPQFAVIGILVMAWGDGLAAVVGQHWGRHKYQLGRNKKSWEGSGTMFLVSGLVVLLVLWGVYGLSLSVVGIAVVVGAIATFLEAFSLLGIDNLTVPLGSALLAFYFCQVFLGS